MLLEPYLSIGTSKQLSMKSRRNYVRLQLDLSTGKVYIIIFISCLRRDYVLWLNVASIQSCLFNQEMVASSLRGVEIKFKPYFNAFLTETSIFWYAVDKSISYPSAESNHLLYGHQLFPNYQIIWQMSCHVMSCHIVFVMPCRVVSCHTMSCDVMSAPMLWT